MDPSRLTPAAAAATGRAARRPSQTLPFVSVIVPVRNAERAVRDCLVSPLRMDYPPDRREIIVVDNGSTDGTAAARSAVRARRRGAGERGLDDPHFTFLLQLAARVGFLWGSLVPRHR